MMRKVNQFSGKEVEMESPALTYVHTQKKLCHVPSKKKTGQPSHSKLNVSVIALLALGDFEMKSRRSLGKGFCTI